MLKSYILIDIITDIRHIKDSAEPQPYGYIRETL